MIDPERLAAFALMTAATSVVPGVSMLFVVGRTIRHGWRSGAAGLAGMQLGYIGWWLLAGLGLDRPAQSLADTGTFEAFDKARGYLPYGSGWVDTRRLVALIGTPEAGIPATAKA